MSVRDTAWPAGTPCWVDLMTPDQPAAQQFYAALFGWELEIGGDETGNYASCSIGGRRVAGIGGMMGMDHPPVWNTYLATDDADATSARGRGRRRHGDGAGDGRDGSRSDGLRPGARRRRVRLLASRVAHRLRAGQRDRRRHLERVHGPRLRRRQGVLRERVRVHLHRDRQRRLPVRDDGGRRADGGRASARCPTRCRPTYRRTGASTSRWTTATPPPSGSTELGGSVLRPPMDMPYGRHADVADPQGAAFSVIKPPSGS